MQSNKANGSEMRCTPLITAQHRMGPRLPRQIHDELGWIRSKKEECCCDSKHDTPWPMQENKMSNYEHDSNEKTNTITGITFCLFHRHCIHAICNVTFDYFLVRLHRRWLMVLNGCCYDDLGIISLMIVDGTSKSM